MSYITIIGNVGKDPEVKTVGSDNKRLVEFTVAENRYGSEHPTWRTLTAWESDNTRRFEFISNHVKKGSLVRACADHYKEMGKDKEGNDREYDRYALLDVQFIGVKRDGDRNNDSKSASSEPSESPY